MVDTEMTATPTQHLRSNQENDCKTENHRPAN